MNNKILMTLFLFIIPFCSAFGQQGLIMDSIVVEREKQTLSFLNQFRFQLIGNLRDAEYLTMCSLQMGEETDAWSLEKAELALRKSRLFQSVRIEIDTLDSRHCMPYIVTREALPSYGPGIFTSIGGGESAIGVRFETKRMFGHAMHLLLDIRNRTELGIGIQGMAGFHWNTAFDMPLSLGFNLRSHTLTTELSLDLSKSPQPTGGMLYGAQFKSGQGIDFVFNGENPEKVSFEFQEISAWAGWLLPRRDDLYFTLHVKSKHAERGNAKTVQAFDNTQSVLLGFGSLADRTVTLNERDIPIGAWGTAVLGRIMPSNGKTGESYYYVGGFLEQSDLMLNNTLYMAGSVSAGSGISKGTPINTALDIDAVAHWNPIKTMAILGFFSQRSVWNWDGFRQLTLDNDNGVRGIPLNRRFGPNRMAATVECRADMLSLPMNLRLGMTGFADVGTVWNAGDPIFGTQWSSALGLGLAISGDNIAGFESFPYLRIEYAYGLQEHTYSGIVLATSFAIPTIKTHGYALPKQIGLGIDTE
jgi:hypothetical protein